MDEESWPAGVSTELVSYARELAIAPDQTNHWVSFFADHPQGRLAWEEIRRVLFILRTARANAMT